MVQSDWKEIGTALTSKSLIVLSLFRKELRFDKETDGSKSLLSSGRVPRMAEKIWLKL